MTNKLFTAKGRREQATKEAVNIIAMEIYKLICRFVLTLHEGFAGFYPKKCNLWLDTLAVSLRQGNEWETDGVYTETMERLCAEYHVDERKLRRIVERFAGKFDNASKNLMFENLRIMFLQTATDFGLGLVRLNRLADMLLYAKQPDDPIAAAREAIGMQAIECGFDLDLLFKKEKPLESYGEAVRLRREFLKYKQYYERECDDDEGTNEAI